MTSGMLRAKPKALGRVGKRNNHTCVPLPAHEFACCRSQEVTLNGYSQVTYDTNRYSVPVELAQKQLTLKAYPFVVEIVGRQSDHC